MHFTAHPTDTGMINAQLLATLCNTEDPISLEPLSDLPLEQLYALKVGDKLYGFNIDTLFQWPRKTRNSNPITNLPLSELELALISEKYIEVHRKDGIISIQVNSEMGWEYGLITVMVGAFGELTIEDLVPAFRQAIEEARIDDFAGVSSRYWLFIYAGMIFGPQVRLADIPGFVAGHKFTLGSTVVPRI